MLRGEEHTRQVRQLLRSYAAGKRAMNSQAWQQQVGVMAQTRELMTDSFSVAWTRKATSYENDGPPLDQFDHQ